MEVIKENIVEIITFFGVLSISIGSFLISTIIGFIVTGALLLIVAILSLSKGGD